MHITWVGKLTKTLFNKKCVQSLSRFFWIMDSVLKIGYSSAGKSLLLLFPIFPSLSFALLQKNPSWTLSNPQTSPWIRRQIVKIAPFQSRSFQFYAFLSQTCPARPWIYILRSVVFWSSRVGAFGGFRKRSPKFFRCPSDCSSAGPDLCCQSNLCFFLQTDHLFTFIWLFDVSGCFDLFFRTTWTGSFVWSG